MGRIEAICISPAKGTVKRTVDHAELRADHGIVGDAHAGDWHRQVSLLPSESIARMRDLMPGLADGAFAENLVTSGVDLGGVKVGDLVAIGGDVLLEVTQIGKECHQGCEIRRITGDCIMPREGIFCRVLCGGRIVPGSEAVLRPRAAT
jgi:MOSC domain-containing protein YiiM